MGGMETAHNGARETAHDGACGKASGGRQPANSKRDYHCTLPDWRSGDRTQRVRSHACQSVVGKVRRPIVVGGLPTAHARSPHRQMSSASGEREALSVEVHG